HRQGGLGADALDAGQGGEGAALVAGQEAVEARAVLGRPAGFDVQGRLVSGGGQALKRARSADHDIADAGAVDQAVVGLDLGQHAFQTADHAAPASRTRLRSWAWVMATARASAAS